jgi:serine/threonine protein kinase
MIIQGPYMVRIVMELARGTFMELVHEIPNNPHENNNKMSEQHACLYMHKIIEEVRYYQEELGAVHRDLSPNNVLVVGDEGRPEVPLHSSSPLADDR